MYLLVDATDSIVPNPPGRTILCWIGLPEAGACVNPRSGGGGSGAGEGGGGGGGADLRFWPLDKHIEMKAKVLSQITVDVEVIACCDEAPHNIYLPGAEGKLFLRKADGRVGVWEGLDQFVDKDVEGVSHKKEDRRWMLRRRPAFEPIESFSTQGPCLVRRGCRRLDARRCWTVVGCRWLPWGASERPSLRSPSADN